MNQHFETPETETRTVVMHEAEIEFGFLKWFCEQFGFELAGINNGLIFLVRRLKEQEKERK